MRQPSTSQQLYAWHRAAVAAVNNAGGFPIIDLDDPQCGWFKMRVIRGGPWVPVTIWCEQVIDENGELAAPEILRCQTGRETANVYRVWPHCCGRPITEADWRMLLSLPTDIMEATKAKVDLARTPLRPPNRHLR